MKRKILEGYKKVGKKLIPPALQIPNLEFTEFRNETLPDLIWMAAIFNNLPDRVSVRLILDFLDVCRDVISESEMKYFTFMSNFNVVNDEVKKKIVTCLKEKNILGLLRDSLKYQNYLFSDYPLKFLFEYSFDDINQSNAIRSLEGDVDSLLDRYSESATKIQVTAFVGMLSSGKMFISKNIEMPDFDSIFVDPKSDAAKRAASFARASLNSSGMMLSNNEIGRTWCRSFWRQCFKLSRCKYE